MIKYIPTGHIYTEDIKIQIKYIKEVIVHILEQ